jgi:hypothetical protein
MTWWIAWTYREKPSNIFVETLPKSLLFMITDTNSLKPFNYRIESCLMSMFRFSLYNIQCTKLTHLTKTFTSYFIHILASTSGIIEFHKYENLDIL